MYSLQGDVSHYHWCFKSHRPCLNLGASPNMISLITSRAIQGVGVGGCFSLTFVIMADITTPRERGKLQGTTIEIHKGLKANTFL